jgi:hypothetical protein
LLLAAMPALDLSDARLDDPTWLTAAGLDPRVIDDVRALRRVHEVVPEVALAAALVERGVRSAIQLAAIPRSEFAARFLDLFNSDIQRMDEVLNSAREIQRRVLLEYMRTRQTGDPRLPVSLARKRRAP